MTELENKSSRILIKFTTSKILFVLYLIYPLFYILPIAKSLGYRFEAFFFLGVIAIQIMLLSLHAKINVSLWSCFILFILSAIVLLQSSDPKYVKPVIFSVFLFTLIPFRPIAQESIKKIVCIILILSLIASFIFTFIPSSYYMGRYIGYTLSPTTYSVFLDVLLVLGLIYLPKKWQKTTIFLIILFFIFLTKTRLNLVFALCIPFLLLIVRNKVIPKKIIYVGFITTLFFLYPAYKFISQTSFIESMVEERYGNTRDASFGLRANLQQIGLEKLQETSMTKLLVGHGSEYTRQMVEEQIGADIYLHNDFIRLIIDFGIFFFFLYLFFIYNIAKKNNAAFLLLLLYIFSFYHNMVYSFNMIGLIYLLGKDEAN